MFKKLTFVKPAGSKEEDGWVVEQMNILQNLFDDLKRYGLKMAARNFFFIILH